MLVTDLLTFLEIAIESFIEVINGANKLLMHDERLSLSTNVDSDHICAKFACLVLAFGIEQQTL